MPTIRVMTFNIASAIQTQNDGVNAWEHRFRLNIQTIKRYSPDLIGFQQLDADNLKTYQFHLREYEYMLGPETDTREVPDYNAIYWKTTSLELLSSGGFYLSKTPNNWSRDWDAVYVRAASWVKFRTCNGGYDFLHINTHYDHIGEEARVEGTKVLLRNLAELRGKELPVIFTGDFNCPPWSPSYNLMRAQGCIDTFLASGGEDSKTSSTFHRFEGEQYRPTLHQMSGRIDWILTLDGKETLRTLSSMIAHDQELPVYPSDHYPVVTDLLFSH